MNPNYRSCWGRIWGVWLAVVAVSFAILEGVALVKRKPGDTLSENTRHWLDISDGRRLNPKSIAFLAALVAFVVWFGPHIVAEIW